MGEITDGLVHLAARGDRDATDQLFTRLHGEIKQIVVRLLGRGQGEIQATDVVDRVWEKLVKQRDPKWSDRNHFLRFVVLTVRRLLAEARRPKGGLTVRTTGRAPKASERRVEFSDLDECLRKLEEGGKSGPRIAEVVLLRCLTDLTWPDIAASLHVSERTAKSDWAFGRAFVQRYLGDPR